MVDTAARRTMGGYAMLVAILTAFCSLQVATGQLPTIGHSVTVYEVSEGGMLEVCLTIMAAPGGPLGSQLSIDVSDQNLGQTADNEDYDTGAFPVTVTFEIGDTATATRCATPAVSIVSDGLAEGPEAFAVIMSFDMSSYVADPVVASVNINDEDDDPIVSLTSAVYTAFENETSVTICAVLTLLASEFPGGLPAEVTVELNTTDGTADSPDDYTAVSEVLMFPASSVDGAMDCVDVPIIDDGSPEPTESFSVSLSSISFGAGITTASTGTPSTAVVNIIDSTAIDVALQVSNPTPLEGDVIQVCVVLTGANTSQSDVVVVLSATDGLATEPQDYTLPAPFSVTFPSADFSADIIMQCLNITIVEDSDVECDHDFTVGIESITPEVSNDLSSTVTVTIDDSADVGSIMYGFEMMSYNVSEGDIFDLILRITGLSNLFCNITVNLTATDIEAVLGEDYVVPDPFTVTFNCGSLSSSSASITILDDDIVEETTETFSVSVTGSDVAGFPLGVSTTVSITDNEDPTDLIVTIQSNMTAQEGDIIELCVNLDTGGSGMEISVEVLVAVLECGAVEVTDFSSPPQNVTFLPTTLSSLMECFNITILDDDVLECDDIIFKVLIGGSTPTVTVGTPSSATVEIINNDFLTVSLQSVSPVTEGVDATVCVAAAFPAGGSDCNVTITLNVTDGTATGGVDFNAPSLMVTIPSFTTMACVDIATVDDMFLENDEDFTVSLSSSDPAQGVVFGATTVVSVTILDGEDPAEVVVGMELATRGFTEGDVGSVCAQVQDMGSIADIQREITVTLTTLDLTTVEVEDYTSGSLTVTFPDTSNVGTTECATFTIVDDSILELDQQFQVQVVTPTDPNVTLSMPSSTTTVTITDNDNVTLVMSTMAGGIGKRDVALSITQVEGTNATVCATLQGSTQTDVSAMLTVVNSSKADPGSDYNFLSMTVSFPAGSADGSSSCISIEVLDDDNIEGDHFFSVAIDAMSATPGPMYVLIGSPDELVVNIMDNDGGMVAFASTADLALPEEDPSDVDVTVSLTIAGGGSLECDVEVFLQIVNSTKADIGVDFTIGTTVTFGTMTHPMGGTASVQLAALDDNNLEGDQSFTLIIGSTSNDLITIDPTASAIDVTIMDDENATVSLDPAVPTINVNESVGSFQVCVVFTEFNLDTLDCNVTVSIIGSSGTAMANEDFDPGPYDAVFVAGETNSSSLACVDIIVVDDDIFESDHLFVVAISAATPSAVIVGSIILFVTIIDDDVLSVAMAQDSYIVDEGDGFAMVCAQVTGPAGGAEVGVIAEALLEDISKAEIGVDVMSTLPVEFTFPVGSLPGSNIACANISIFDDSNFESNHAFSVDLNLIRLDPAIAANPRPVIDSPGSANVTIIDNDEVEVDMQLLNYVTTEGAGTVEVCANITRGSIDCDIRATLASTDGPKAALGSDFTLSTTSLDFLAGGSTISCLNITILDDEAFEGDHTFMVNVQEVTLLSGETDALLMAGAASATITIQDNDDVEVTVTKTTDVVGEEDGTVQLCAMLDSSSMSRTLECNLTASFDLSNGTKGGEGDDFSASSPLQAVFASISDKSCVTITINDDNVFESNHTFTNTLTSLEIDGGTSDPNLSVGSPDSTTVTITDNDDVSVVMEEPQYTCSETNTTCEVSVLLLAPEGGIACDVIATLAAVNGTKAVLTSDYLFPNSTVTCPAGATNGTALPLSFTIVDDMALEGSHSFSIEIVSVETPSGPDSLLTIGSPSTADVVIEDNDRVTLGFVQPAVNVFENQSLVEVCIAISDIPTGGLECDVEATIGFGAGGKTTVDIDFNTPGTPRIIFNTSSTSGTQQCVNINITDDMIVEGHQMIVAGFDTGSETPLGQIDFSPSSSLITVMDNDVVLLAFTQSEYPTSEDLGYVEVCVELMQAPAGGLECDILVELGVQDGAKAVLGQDYDPVVDPLEVRFVAGVDGQGATACANITIVDDDALEGPHEFSVTLADFDLVGGTPDTARIFMGTPSSASVLIEDNEDATVNFTSSVFPVNETDGSVHISIALYDIPAGGLECAIEVTIGATDGAKAVAGEDYSLMPNPVVLTIPTTVIEGVPIFKYVTIIDDMALEGEHSFTISILSTSPNISRGSPSEADVEITDNDGATVTLQESSYKSAEGDGYLMVCVEISDIPSGGLECDIVVSLQATDGTAESPTDYEVPAPFEVTIPQGASNGTLACTNVTIVDNDILDCQRYFQIDVVSTSLDPLVAIGSPSQATVYIEDNENATIFLWDNATEVLEGAGTGSVEVCVGLYNLPSGGLDCNITVELGTINITAKEGLDYEAITLSIIIPAGSANGSLTCCDTIVTILDDDIVEYSERFGIELVSSDPVLYIGDPNSEPVVIVDDDKVTVGFRVQDSDYGPVYTVYEGNMTQVCVQLTGRLERPVNVSVDAYYQPIGQIDKGNRNDFSIPSLITFGDSASFCNTLYTVEDECFYIMATDDSSKEDDEYFKLLLNSYDSQVCFCQDFALFRIAEDENDGVYAFLKYTSLVVSESAGSLYVCIEIVGILETQVTVTIHTTDGSALAGYDYIEVYQELLFDGCLNFTEQCLHIPILNDVCLEEKDEYFYINISSSLDCVKVNDSHEVVTIVDDDCVVIGLESEYTRYAEDAGYISVCAVIKSGQIKRDVSVYLNVDERDTAGDIVASSPVMLTFTPSTASYDQCVNISIVDDHNLENTESFSVFLNTTDDYVKLDYADLTLYIEDNDCATLAFSMAEYTVSELQIAANVCVVLTGHVDRVVIATVCTVEGSAVAGSDFVDTSEDLVFSSQGQICIEIPINSSDAALEGNETFVVVLTTRDDDIKISRKTAPVTIIDESMITIGFEQTSYTTPEEDNGNGAVLEVCVTIISSGSEQLERLVSVTLSTAEGSATAGEDYNDILVSQTSIELVFSVGGSRRRKRNGIPGGSPVECVNISIISDSIVEDDEMFSLNLETNDPDVVLSPASAQVTILSDDVATVSLEESSYTVDEDDGVVEICAELIYGDLQTDISVYLSTMDDSAVDSDDYTAVVNCPLQFQSGAVVGSTVCKNITIIDNLPVEDCFETFNISLSTNDPQVILVNSSGTVTIVDDDFVTVSFNMSEYTTIEDDTSLQVCVDIIAGSLERNIEVQLTSMDGSAKAGEDFVGVDTTLSFGPGDSQMCTNVAILEDAVVEYYETFTLKLTSADKAVVFGEDTAEVTIAEDNDTVTIGFERATFFVQESAGFLWYHVHIWGWLQRVVVVNIEATNGIAILGDDYMEPENASITLSSGLHGHYYLWLRVYIVEDLLYEGDENFFLVLSSNDPAAVFNLSMAEVIIADDDPVVLGLEQEEYTVCEGDGFVTVCLELISGQLASTVELSANLSTQDITAQGGGVDYYTVQDYPLILPGGSVPCDLSCVNISISDDSIVEYNEAFGVSLAYEAQSLVTFNLTAATITIKDDNDSVTVGWNMVEYTTTEAQGGVEVCIDLVAGTLERSVEIDVLSMDGSATAGQDYELVSTTVVLNESVSQVYITLTILQDSNVEDDEDFTVNLSSSDQAVQFSDDTTLVSIVGDEDTVTVGFQQASYIVGESDVYLQFHVHIWGWLERDVTVNISATDGSATLGEDYMEPENASITLSSGLHGHYYLWLRVFIVGNLLYEADENFFLVLSSNDAAVVFNQSMAEVTIEDDDPVAYRLQQVQYTVCESETMQIVCTEQVSGVLSPGSTIMVLFETYDIPGNQAQAGADYTALSFIRTISEGASALSCVTVVLTPDTLPENCSDEIFGINLTAVSPGVIIQAGYEAATIEIVDDDQPGDPDFSVTFTNDTPMVSGLNVTLDLLTRGMECPTEFVCDVDGVGPVDCGMFSLPEQRFPYLLTVEASSVCGGTAEIERRFRIDNARQCGAHFINDGVTIAADGLSATFEFEGTGPNATVQVDVFQCRVNSNSFIPCGSGQNVDSYVVVFSDFGLTAGDHMLTVRPTREVAAELGCNRRPGNPITFTVP